MSALSPRVYVACLGCYNAGVHHGDWFDADEEMPAKLAEYFGAVIVDDEPEIRCQKSNLDSRGFVSICGSEEFVVHDYEGFGSLKLGEVGYSEAAEIGQKLLDLGDDAEIVTAVMENNGCDLDEAEEHFRDEYQGEHDSLEDWAADFHEQCGTVPKDFPLASYIDWAAVARDAELGGDVFTIELGGKVHVFWNR